MSPIESVITSKLKSLVNENIFKHLPTYSTLYYTLIVAPSVLSLCNILMRQGKSKAFELGNLDYDSSDF